MTCIFTKQGMLCMCDMLVPPEPQFSDQSDDGVQVLEEAISTAVKLGLAAPHDHVVCVERIHDSFCVKVVAGEDHV